MTRESAPSPLKALTRLVPGPVGQRVVAGGAAAGVLAGEAVLVGRGVDHVAGAAASDVEDRGHVLLAAHLALELLVEAEDGPLAAAVDIASTTTTGLEGGRGVRVQTGQRWRAGGGLRVGCLGVPQRDDIAGAASGGVQSWTSRVGHAWVRFDDHKGA